jgi:hypothetical protein
MIGKEEQWMIGWWMIVRYASQKRVCKEQPWMIGKEQPWMIGCMMYHNYFF